jgi:hypothetical protein
MHLMQMYALHLSLFKTEWTYREELNSKTSHRQLKTYQFKTSLGRLTQSNEEN